MSSSNTRHEYRTPGAVLPNNYQPSPHTVIVGRGNEPKQNLGNKRLRVLASSFLTKYQQGDKKCKSQIVSDIICMIRDACKGGKGAFVKHSKKTGLWYDLDNSVAREKVGYVFRDLLADQYKSSSKSKVARRQRPSSVSPFPRQVSTSSQCSVDDDAFTATTGTTTTSSSIYSSGMTRTSLVQQLQQPLYSENDDGYNFNVVSYLSCAAAVCEKESFPYSLNDQQEHGSISKEESDYLLATAALSDNGEDEGSLCSPFASSMEDPFLDRTIDIVPLDISSYDDSASSGLDYESLMHLPKLLE